MIFQCRLESGGWKVDGGWGGLGGSNRLVVLSINNKTSPGRERRGNICQQSVRSCDGAGAGALPADIMLWRKATQSEALS